MAIVLYDRVRETSTTTGLGDFTLLGAVSGYIPFSAVVGANAFAYCIAHRTADEWEVGETTLSAGALVRGGSQTVRSSSNANAAVTFSAGTKDVFLHVPANWLNNIPLANLEQIDAASLVCRPQGTAGDITFLSASTANTVPFYDGSGLGWGKVQDSYMRNSAALSVIGRSANSAGAPADIAAANGSGLGILSFNDTTNTVVFFQSTTAGFVKSDGSALSILAALAVGDLPALNGFTDADPALADVVPIYDSSAAANRDSTLDKVGGLVNPMAAGGRLTLLYGDPAPSDDQAGGAIPASTDTTADTVTFTNGHGWSTGQAVGVTATGGGLTGGTTLYFARVVSSTSISFHPTFADAQANTNKMDLTASITATVVPGIHYQGFSGDTLTVYDGTRLVERSIPAGLAVKAHSSSSQTFDVFGFDSSGTLDLEILAWTNDTTRATALAYQNGFLVKSGAATRRYLGTCRTTTTAYQTKDTAAARLLWNHYNRLHRRLKVIDSTDTWTYTTAAFRAANNSTANRVEIVTGQTALLDLFVVGQAECTVDGNGITVGIDEDGTTTNDADLVYAPNSITGKRVSLMSLMKKYPALGYHYYQWTEYSTASGTTTWYGDGGAPDRIQSGLLGWVEG